MSGRDLTDSEKRAWARVARSVRPLAEPFDPPVGDEAASTQTPRNQPVRKRRPRRDTPDPPQTRPPRPDIAERSGERRIRRGRVDLHGRIDLHGHTQASADRALSSYISSARAAGSRTVLVITGKGRGGEGVLRRNFLYWLDSPVARSLVSGWAPAHPKHGGAGAFYVFLRRG